MGPLEGSAKWAHSVTGSNKLRPLLAGMQLAILLICSLQAHNLVRALQPEPALTNMTATHQANRSSLAKPQLLSTQPAIGMGAIGQAQSATTSTNASLMASSMTMASARGEHQLGNHSMAMALDSSAASSGNGSEQQQQQQQQQQFNQVKSAAKGAGSIDRAAPGQVGGSGSNSPAFNSRQRNNSLKSHQPNDARQQRVHQHDNQMAADDVHETQANLMTLPKSITPGAAAVNSLPAPTSISATTTTTTTKAVGEADEKARPSGKPAMANEMAPSQRNQPAMKSSSSKQTVARQQETSGRSGWQTVSTSVGQSGAAASSGVWPTSPRQRNAFGSGAGQKYLPPPPPPVNYNNFYPQQQIESTQLERPMSGGYSYGPTSYTHTEQLAPARQELLEPASMSRQRQISALDEPPAMGKAASFFPRLAPTELPHFPPVASQPYSAAQQQPYGPTQQVAAMHSGGYSNPCKPAGQTLQQQQQQHLQEQSLLLGNDLSSAASSQQHLAARSSASKFLRLGAGTRLKTSYIFKVLRADSLTDCELACAQSLQQQDTCRSFNYRAYFAAENCELSRSDARQLKLDDPSQFEQHTQFDFYALPTTAEPSSAQLLNVAPIVQQQQQQQLLLQQVPYTPAAGLEQDCLEVSQSCSQDGMEFTLRTLEPFTGRIYTYGFYESCYFDGDGRAQSTLKISRSNGFPRCGTQQIGDLMTNIVVVQFNDHVQTSRDKKYNLTCYFSGPGEAVVTSSYFDTKLDERSHPMQIEHLPPQNVITSNVHLRILHHGTPTNAIAVGDLLTFRLESSSPAQAASQSGPASGQSSGTKQGRAGQLQHQHQHQHEIFATNVIAKDPYSGRQVQLIDARGCPVDPVNVFPELQRTSDGALESEFYAFKMPDSNFLIFQATVRACKSPCEPVICHRAPPQSPLLAGHQQAQYQLSSGVKGGHLQQQLQQPQPQPPPLGAYLMTAAQQNAVPSWGRRRKRRSATDETRPDDADGSGELDADMLGAGESVEHVIPVRLGPSNWTSESAPGGVSRGVPQVVTRVRRPELSEPEEEVKEMFRVYLTRAELDNRRRQQLLESVDRAGEDRERSHEADSPMAPHSGRLKWKPEDPGRDELATLDEGHICLTQTDYYVMLFAVIALSLIVLSVLLVAFYVTRKAKFHISETLADAMF